MAYIEHLQDKFKTTGKTVLLTGETKWEHFGTSASHYVWGKLNTNHKKIIPKVEHGGGSVMVGVFCPLTNMDGEL